MCHLSGSLFPSELVWHTEMWDMKGSVTVLQPSPKTVRTHTDKSSRVFSSSVFDKSEFSLLSLNIVGTWWSELKKVGTLLLVRVIIFGILIHGDLTASFPYFVQDHSGLERLILWIQTAGPDILTRTVCSINDSNAYLHRYLQHN